MFINELWHWTGPEQGSITLGKGYRSFLIILTIFVLPWVVLGWQGVNRECVKCMGGFALGSLAFLANGIFLLFVDPQSIFKDIERSWRFLQFLVRLWPFCRE
jgi:uncharacterized sodium:solute symporter family permease YidK